MMIMMQPIQIKRPDVAEDIRALAALTGGSITETVANAVRAQLAIERAKAVARQAQRRAEAERLLGELRSLPIVGPEISDGDIYDSEGLSK
jgi:hypothetical protein